MLKREGVPFWPDVAWRDMVFGVLVVICVVFLAWHFGAPELTTAPDPTIIQAYPRPDWYLPGISPCWRSYLTEPKTT